MEAPILKRLRQNDSATQKAVYYQHADRLMAIVLRYVPSIMEAEDVLQDSFLKIWSKITTYDKNKGRLFTWMLKFIF